MPGRGCACWLEDFCCTGFRRYVWPESFPAAACFPPYSGCSSEVFFGFEDIIDAVWLRPQEAMTDLPFIGRLNTVFVVAVAIGMGIILLCMILNIINSLRTHDVEKAYFDTNGVAGLVFYFALASVIVLYMTGNPLPATVILIIMFLIPLLVIFFKEPLAAILEKKGGTDGNRPGNVYHPGYI